MWSALMTPKANRGKLQKSVTKRQACQKQDAQSSQIPRPHPGPSSTKATRDRSIACCLREEAIQEPVPASASVPAAVHDANDQEAAIGNVRRKVVIVDNMHLAKQSCESTRNLDSGIVLAPPSSPAQQSPPTAIISTDSQPLCAFAAYSLSDEQRQETASRSNGTKRSHDNAVTASPGPVPQGQNRTCEPPACTSNIGVSQISNSFLGASTNSIPTTVAPFIPILPSSPSMNTTVLRTSTYPVPMERSPLIDNATMISHDGADDNVPASSSSISTGSSSSSLQRLYQRVSQRPALTSTRSFYHKGRPVQGFASPVLDSVNELDQYSAVPYEALPVAGPAPTFVSQPVTPRFVAHATSTVASPLSPDGHGSPDEQGTCARNKKSKQSSSRLLGSLFHRNVHKGRGQQQTEGSLYQTREPKDFQATLAALGNNNCDHCGSSTALHVPPPPRPMTRTQQSHLNALSPAYQDHYATKPLPLPPLPPRDRRNANEWPRLEGANVRAEDDPDRDPDTTQRHRRRALFALDGLTIYNTVTRDFDTFAGRQGVTFPPASPPLVSSPILESALRDEMEESQAQVLQRKQGLSRADSPNERALQIGATKMSDDARQLFIRKGKEAEARVFSAHVCAEPSVRAAVTGNAFAASFESPVPGDRSHAMSEETASLEPQPKIVKKDVAWWEEATTQSTVAAKATRKSKSSISIEKRKPSPTKHQPPRESALDAAMQDLEITARTSRLRPNLKTAFEIVEAEGVAAAHVQDDAGHSEVDAGPNKARPSATKRRRPPPPPPPSPVEAKDHVAASAVKSQQVFSSEETESHQRGRQLARDIFRRHREAGRWDFTVRTDEASSIVASKPVKKTVHTTQSYPEVQEVSPISDASNNQHACNFTEHPVSPIDSSNSSSGASLNATIFRAQQSKKSKARQPHLDPTEAAIAVQKTVDTELTPTPSSDGSQGDASPESELRRKMLPEPLSVRHHVLEEVSKAGTSAAVVGLGIATVAAQSSTTKTQRRRSPPPPPPPQHPLASTTAPLRSASGTAYMPLPFTTIAPGATLQKASEPRMRRPPPPPPAPPSTPQRAPTPPIPPRSDLRPKLGGNWSGMSLQELKRTLIATNGNGRGTSGLTTRAEEARGSLDDGVQGKGRGVSRYDSAGQAAACDDGDESVYSEHDEDRFWSDDENDAVTRAESSKKTTPEKDGMWVPPTRLRTAEEDVDDEESQLLDYYLDAQRADEERERREAEQAKLRAEQARKSDDEARAKRVANLLAKIRECDG